MNVNRTLVIAIVITCIALLSSCSGHATAERNGFALEFTSAGSVATDSLPDRTSPSRDYAERSKNSVTLSWDLPDSTDGIDGYFILRRFGEDGSFREIAKVSPDTSSYNDGDVDGRGTEAFYLIVSYAKDGGSVKLSPCAGYQDEAQPRLYQNPEGLVQIADRIPTHGYNYYTSPVLTGSGSTREDHIEALISTAYEYEGDEYVNRQSGPPGPGVDCSGLVMQAAYGAGVDLWPSNPYRHFYGADKYEWESREIEKLATLKDIPAQEAERGDLIFYANKDDVVVHVAIYLGEGKIIHSTRKGGVCVTGLDYNSNFHVCSAKRIFN